MNIKLTKPVASMVLILLVTIVGTADYMAGYELRLGALYAVIVGFATWYLGMTMGLITAVVSVAISHWAEQAGGKIYTEEWVAYANSTGRLSIYLFVVMSFAYFRRTIDHSARQLRAFQGRLPICSCCHRVDGGGGFWIDFPTYVRLNSPVVPEFKICPLCVREGTKPRIGGS